MPVLPKLAPTHWGDYILPLPSNIMASFFYYTVNSLIFLNNKVD